MGEINVNEIAKETAKEFLLGAIKVIKDLKNDKEKTIVQLVNDVVFTTLLRFCALAIITLPPKLALAVTILAVNEYSSMYGEGTYARMQDFKPRYWYSGKAMRVFVLILAVDITALLLLYLG